MRYINFLLLILTIFGTTVFGQTNNDEAQQVQVETILKSPGDFLDDAITIYGIVRQSIAEKHLFAIISEKEFKKCGITKCNAAEQLPVRYTGELPNVGDEIQVSGNIKKTEQGFIYEAGSIKNIKDIQTE